MKILKRLMIAVVCLVLTKILVFVFIQNKGETKAATTSATISAKAMTYNDLQTMVQMQNKNYPKDHGNGIRVERVSADTLTDGKHAVTFHKTILNSALKDLDRDAMTTPERKMEMAKELCANPATQSLHKDGVSMRNIYRDENNQVLAEYLVRPQDCQATASR